MRWAKSQGSGKEEQVAVRAGRSCYASIARRLGWSMTSLRAISVPIPIAAATGQSITENAASAAGLP
jgi:hypothetical protein